jgi:hypothetical protein
MKNEILKDYCLKTGLPFPKDLTPLEEYLLMKLISK